MAWLKIFLQIQLRSEVLGVRTDLGDTVQPRAAAQDGSQVTCWPVPAAVRVIHGDPVKRLLRSQVSVF